MPAPAPEKRRNQFTKRTAAPGTKICCRCELEQSLDQYTKNCATPDGLDRRCRTCKKELRELNREYSLAYGKKWREENAWYMPEYHRVVRELMTDEDRLRENARLRVMSAKRRQVIKDNFVEEVDYNKVLERDNYICHICKKVVPPEDVHFDHVIPLSAGGAHSYENVKVAHSLCNQRKGARVTPKLKVSG